MKSVKGVKNMTKPTLKRPIRIYEDAENHDQAKVLKTLLGKTTMGAAASEKQRRPLADINNQDMQKSKNKAEDEVTKNKIINHKKKTEGVITVKPVRSVVHTVSECSNVGKQEDLTLNEGLNKNFPSSVNVIAKKRNIQEQNQKAFTLPYYIDDVYNYLFRLEKRFVIPKNHLEGQVLNGLMRAVLVDWLSGVVEHMDLMQETLQLTVYILDKFMATDKSTTKTTAQLIGLGALYVASKYEETETIELNDLTFICDKAWRDSDIKSMECTILKTIDYLLGRPLAIHFIRRLSKISGASPMEHSYAKYFADTSLLSYQLCHIKSSMIAAASLFLAFCISRDRIDSQFWTPRLTSVSRYELSDFRHLLPQIARTVTGAETCHLQGIRTRYANSQLFCVSLMPGCSPDTGIINQFELDSTVY